MQRLFLLTLTATSVMHASSLTYASCTYGSATQTNTDPTSVSCLTQVSDSTGPVGVLEGDALTFFYSSGTRASLDGDAVVVADFQVSQNSSWGVTASFNNSLELTTQGPQRAGFIQFGFVTNNSGVPGYVSISDGVHHYSYQQSVGTMTLPFDLGSPFDVAVSASPSIGGPAPTPHYEKMFADARLSFSLLEANGTTVVPLFVTPEPTTWALVLVGMCGLLRRFAGSLLRRDF